MRPRQSAIRKRVFGIAAGGPVFLLEIDEHQHGSLARPIGLQMEDGTHNVNLAAVSAAGRSTLFICCRPTRAAERTAARPAERSKIPGTCQRPSGRMIT